MLTALLISESALPAVLCMESFNTALREENLSKEKGTEMLNDCITIASNTIDATEIPVYSALKDLLAAKLLWFQSINENYAEEDYEIEKSVWLYTQEKSITELPKTGDIELAIKQLDVASKIGDEKVKDELAKLIKVAREAGDNSNDAVVKSLHFAMVAYLEEKYEKDGSENVATIMEKRMEYTKALNDWKKNQLENVQWARELPATVDMEKVENDISKYKNNEDYENIRSKLEMYKEKAVAVSNLRNMVTLHEKFLIYLEAMLNDVYDKITIQKTNHYEEALIDWKELPIKEFGLPLTKEMMTAHRALNTISCNDREMLLQAVNDLITATDKAVQGNDENPLNTSWLNVLVALKAMLSSDGEESEEKLLALKTVWDDYYKNKN